MNAYRANAGLPELVVSDTVTADARAWSKHMSDSDDFSHDPDYKYFGVGKLDGGDTTHAGENIAYNLPRKLRGQVGCLRHLQESDAGCGRPF